MAQDKFKRKLTTILSADAVGYSRLMGADEAATVKTLRKYKELFSELIHQHRGRVVDSPGDNLLAEFNSVVDAVQCAVATQKELQARNADFPENRRMQFRIGVNLGDVIEEDSRIYGDGVNIAARLEGLAEPGGICVSKTAFDHIETKLPLSYQFLGEQTVKNIAKPVVAYKVLMESRVLMEDKAKKATGSGSKVAKDKRTIIGLMIAVIMIIGAVALCQFLLSPKEVEKADPEKMAFPLPEKPSIAVLPFVNMSDDPKHQFFADGIAEEIINALATLSQVYVTARNSSFTYKGKAVDVRQIGRELGVKYVLEGSIRWDQQRVRVTAQLVDASSGKHLFSERYDRELKEIFATQDEITIAIVRALRVTATSGEQAQLTGKGTNNLDAYLKGIQANEQFFLMNRQGSIKAKEFAREASVLDPSYAFPYAVLSNAHMLDVFLGFSESPEHSMKLADDAAHKALSLDDRDPCIHSTLTNLYVLQRQYDKAIASADRALILGPGAARSHWSMGTALTFSCRFAEAIPFYEEAIRLDPYPPSPLLRLLGGAYSAVGRHDEALKKYEMALRFSPDDVFAHLSLAALYVELGKHDEARAEARDVLRIHPKFYLDSFSKTLTFKDQSYVDRRIELLRKAGLR